jgi:Family of unknown function (DUF6056)
MANSHQRFSFRGFVNKLMPVVLVIGTLSTGLALMSYAVLGFFSRYYADDYCMSGLAFQKGFWQAQIDQYVGWSNRYAGMFVLSLSDLLGHSAIKFWTAFTILLLVLAFTWMLAQLDVWLTLSFSKWLLALLAELVVFFTFLFAPQLYQSLFWRVGLITYTLPLAFLAFLGGLVIRFSAGTTPGAIRRGWLAVCFIAAFFAGGFSETYLVLQISLFALGLIAVLFLVKGAAKRNWLTMLVAVLAGSILSLIVVLASPGNAIRQAAMPHPPGLLALVEMVVLHALLFMYRVLAANPFQVLLALLIPLLLIYGFYANREIPRLRPSPLFFILLLAPVIGFVTIAAVMTPAAYAQSSYPDGRVLVEASFLMTVLLVFMGTLTGIIFSQLHQWAGEPVPTHLQGLVAVIAIILLLYPLHDARKNITLLPEYQARAISWDRRDARIRRARQEGALNIQEVANNAPAGLTDLKPDQNDWINRCATWFYDINSITANNP